MANSTVRQSLVRLSLLTMTNPNAQTNWLKFYEEAVIESEARTAVVQLKSET